MEEDWKPFEVRETEKGTTLYLHGTEESSVRVEADKVAKILKAIRRGWNVDVQYAIIDGGIDIHDIELERDESGRCVIAGRIEISNSDINGMASFRSSSFSKETSFADASFNEIANFREASFNGVTSFSGASFKEGASFSGASFNGEASFWGASFNGEASFEKASFKEGASFGRASFKAVTSFSGASLKDDPGLREANYDKLLPYSFASIGQAYRKSMLSGASYFFEKAGHGYWRSGYFLQASEVFRDAKVEYEKEGRYDEAGDMYVCEKDSTRRQLWPRILSKWDRSAKSVTKYLWLNVWKVTCNYGEAPLWFIGWAAFIILFFALIYSPLFNWWPPRSWESWALIQFKEYPYAEGNSFLTALYFSVVTFATLGFGDITPMNNLGKVVVIIEVLSGYVMFGILITLVARKMTRS